VGGVELPRGARGRAAGRRIFGKDQIGDRGNLRFVRLEQLSVCHFDSLFFFVLVASFAIGVPSNPQLTAGSPK
jgi:hypothetical protein